MSSPKSSTIGTDWTQLLSDPAVARHLEVLLRAYREATPDKRDQAVLDALRGIHSATTGNTTGQGVCAVPFPNPTPPAAVPPFAPETPASSRGEDRRRHPRMKCFVAVELAVEGSTSPLWGNLANTSMGGCFVETTAVVETGTKLEIGLWVANGKIWVKGIVLTGIVTQTKPCFGVRIRFNNLESNERETLREFLKFVESATQGYNNQHGYLAQMKR
jgi:hypothetical protein